MSLSYIRKTYNVPAKKGMYVEFYEQVINKFGGKEWEMVSCGRITSSYNASLRLDNKRYYHPTYGIVYFDNDGTILCDTRVTK